MKNIYSLLFVLSVQLIFGQLPTLPKNYLFYHTLNSIDLNQNYFSAQGAPKTQTTFTKEGWQFTSNQGVDGIGNALFSTATSSTTKGYLSFNNLISKTNNNSTISFWYKHDATGNKVNLSDHKFFGIKRNDQTDYEALTLGIDNSKRLVAYQYQRVGSTGFNYACLPITIGNYTEDDLKSWHHYTIENSNTVLKIYIDNVLVLTQTYGFYPYALTSSPIYLGGFVANNGAAHSNTTGNFDSFIMYDRVLTDEERTAIYNFRESTTKHHYDFNLNQMDLYGKNSSYFYNAATTSYFTTDRAGNANRAIYTYDQMNNMPFQNLYINRTEMPKFQNGITLTTHFKMTTEQGNSSARYPIASIYNNSHADATPSYYKSYLTLAINKTTKNLEYYIDDINNQRHVFTTNFKINLNEWAVVTTSLFSDELKVYANGNLYHTFDLSGISRRAISTLDQMNFASNMYTIEGSFSTGRDHMLGVFDDVLLDTAEYTPNEVKALYTALTGEPVPDMPTLAVTENTANSALSIYPNPTSSTFRIANLKTSSTVEILDNSGRLLQTQKVSPSQELSVQNLKPGMYLVRIQTGNDVITKKLIKK